MMFESSMQIDDNYSYKLSCSVFRTVGVYRNMRNNENNTRLNFSEWKVLQPSHIQIEDQDAFDRTMNYSQYMTHGDPWKNNLSIRFCILVLLTIKY